MERDNTKRGYKGCLTEIKTMMSNHCRRRSGDRDTQGERGVHTQSPNSPQRTAQFCPRSPSRCPRGEATAVNTEQGERSFYRCRKATTAGEGEAPLHPVMCCRHLRCFKTKQAPADRSIGTRKQDKTLTTWVFRMFLHNDVTEKLEAEGVGAGFANYPSASSFASGTGLCCPRSSLPVSGCNYIRCVHSRMG